MAVALGIAALLVPFAACSDRPLPAEGEGKGGGTIGAPDSGAGGHAGSGCNSGEPRLELIGAPLLALDNPPVTGNLRAAARVPVMK